MPGLKLNHVSKRGPRCDNVLGLLDARNDFTKYQFNPKHWVACRTNCRIGFITMGSLNRVPERPVTLGKFDWGVWYVIIFLYVQFLIRLAAVSKSGKKVRTEAFPVVRSVNKSRDTRNCAQNKPEYAICVIFATRSYYKALGLILCYLI